MAISVSTMQEKEENEMKAWSKVQDAANTQHKKKHAVNTCERMQK
jgi:hypothetical protein